MSRLLGRFAATATLALGGVFAVCALSAQTDVPTAAASPTVLDEAADGPFAFFAIVKPQSADASVSVVFDRQDQQNYYQVTLGADGAQFVKVKDGKAEPLGSSGKARLAAGALHQLAIQRRNWRMSLLLDHELIATGYDAEFQSGEAAYVGRRCEVEEAFLQPVVPVRMSDDFMRTGETGNPWTTVSGTWQYRPVREELPEKEDPTRSSNAFSYQGTAADDAEPAIVVRDDWKPGEYDAWFWQDYSFELSVRPQGAAVGVIFNFQDPANHCLLRWTSEAAPEGGKSQLVQVRNGERTVIDETAGGYIPDYWAALSVRTSQGLVYTTLDHRPGPAGVIAAPAEGGVGMYVEAGATAFFDDAWAKHWEVLTDDFSAPEPGKWRPQGAGEWAVGRDGFASVTPQGTTRLAMGDATWRDYTFAADVKLGKNAAAGVLAYGAGQDAYVLRAAGQNAAASYAGKVEIARIQGDTVRSLASQPLAVSPEKWHRLKLTVEQGYIAGYVDDALLFEATDTGLEAGEVGFYAEGGGQVSFDNAYLRFREERRPVEILAQFVEPGDESMVEWATRAGQWVTPADPTKDPYWHKGAFFGDKTVRLRVPDVGAKSGSVVVLLDDGSDATAALRLVLSTSAGEKTVAARLLRGDSTLAEGQVELSAETADAEVELAKRGRELLAWVNGEPVLAHELDS